MSARLANDSSAPGRWSARAGARSGSQVPGAPSFVFSFALTLALAVTATGCPSRFAERAYAPPTADELTQALALRQRTVTSMNARARATSWLDGQRVHATVLMLVERTGQLRFEAEVSLQGTVGVLATDGTSFAFLDVQHNQLRRGPACPANVASMIRIPLAPPEIAAILLGDVRLPDVAGTAPGQAASPPRVEWDGERRADVLVLPRLGGELRVAFQPTGARAASAAAGAGAGTIGAAAAPDAWRVVGVVAVGAGGSPRWRVAYEDLDDVPTAPDAGTRVAMPRTARFAEGSTSFDEGVEIKFKERTLGERAEPAVFTVEAPPGTTIVDVGCQGS